METKYDFNVMRKKLIDVLKNRKSYTCNHCERQYDDYVCDACFPDLILRILDYAKLIAIANATLVEQGKPTHD